MGWKKVEFPLPVIVPWLSGLHGLVPQDGVHGPGDAAQESWPALSVPSGNQSGNKTSVKPRYFYLDLLLSSMNLLCWYRLGSCRRLAGGTKTIKNRSALHFSYPKSRVSNQLWTQFNGLSNFANVFRLKRVPNLGNHREFSFWSAESLTETTPVNSLVDLLHTYISSDSRCIVESQGLGVIPQI